MSNLTLKELEKLYKEAKKYEDKNPYFYLGNSADALVKLTIEKPQEVKIGKKRYKLYAKKIKPTQTTKEEK
jgi:hypothetical protein